MTAENVEWNVRSEWRRAEDSLAAAEHLIQGRFYAESITRSYYAVFHAARAALLSLELEPTTHLGVRTEFSRRFVQTNRFDRDLARILGYLQKEREDADYGREQAWDEPSSSDSLTAAHRFCSALRPLLLPWLG